MRPEKGYSCVCGYTVCLGVFVEGSGEDRGETSSAPAPGSE